MPVHLIDSQTKKEEVYMMRVKKIMTVLMVTVLMVTGCSSEAARRRFVEDEHDFIRIAKLEEGEGLSFRDYTTNNFVLEKRCQYVVLVCLYNSDATTYQEPVLTVTAPRELAAGETGQMKANVVWDDGSDTCCRSDDLTLKAAKDGGDIAIEWGAFTVHDEAIDMFYYIEDAGNGEPGGSFLMTSDLTDDNVASQKVDLPDIDPGYEYAAILSMMLRTSALSD